MKRSLTGQLFLRILPTVVVMLLLTAFLAFYSCRREINYVHDMQMVNDANVLWNLVEDELNENKGEGIKPIEDGDDPAGISIRNEDEEDYANARMFRIWRNGTLALYSDTAFPPSVAQQKSGFSDLEYHGERWRIYTAAVGNRGIVIEIGEKEELRSGLVWNILSDLFIPLLLAVPFLTLGLWGGIRKGLAATQALVRQIYSRSPDDLSPIDASFLPSDLAPLGNSINRLFTKLAYSINAERRFSDHAAHQLRTPLAGSRLLIQMLAEADTEAERAVILADLATSNDRASELVNKLLTAARVSHQPLRLQPIEVYPIVARVMADMGPMANHKSLALSLDGNEQALAIADETLLSLLATNVVENAIKYTPTGGVIEVEITQRADGCYLSVTDSGPGIAEHERTLVFQRFYRAELSDSVGTGLGLAIVADIVERFGGTITLGDRAEGTGLQVEIRLPSPEAKAKPPVTPAAG